MLATVVVLPCVRAFTKYHRRSLLIGPPNAPLRSYTLENGVGAARPASLSSCVKLSDCRFSPVALKYTAPEMSLPPVLGTTFITSPAVSASPRPPDVVKVTSWALPMSAMYCGG